VTPGSGPRHGAFLQTPLNTTYLFVITELGNTITSYAVTYNPNRTLSFHPVFTSSTYGPRTPAPPGAAAAEVLVSPDGKYLLTSSRNDSLFALPNFNPANATKIPSDSLQVWSIDPATGALAFLQLAPAGGRFPRQFSLNRNGTLAAVGLQMDGRVVVMEREANGTFGALVASVDVEGEVTSVVWDE
jgi:6-phosphogluconolactonase (cycloisomerase 2 family)